MSFPKEKIKKLASEAKVREALRLFRDNTSFEDKDIQNKILGLNGRFSKNKDDFNDGLILDNVYNVELNRITNTILSLADEYANENNAPQLAPLDAAIAALPLSKNAELGVLQLVNCDRRAPHNQFKRAFKAKITAKQPVQFYFISGCPNEMPNSLAERIVYEIIEDESLELNGSIDFPFSEGTFKRVKIENLPLSIADVAASKKKFKEYIQKRFAFADADTFERFIETGIPKLPYAYVATVFQITESDWEDAEVEMFDYLQWLMDTFQTAHPKVPTFLFLFALHFRNLDSPKKVNDTTLSILQNLDAFCKKNDTTLFRGLEPIKDLHFEDWLSRLGVVNPNDIEALTNAMSDGLKPENKLSIDGARRFYMKDVEPVQMKVIQAFRQEK